MTYEPMAALAECNQYAHSPITVLVSETHSVVSSLPIIRETNHSFGFFLLDVLQFRADVLRYAMRLEPNLDWKAILSSEG